MKKWGIIGAIVICAASIVSYLFNFPAEAIITIGCAAFGLTSLIVGAVKDIKGDKLQTWAAYVCIMAAIAGGIFCCIGGVAQSVIAEVVGATLALLAVIFSILTNKKVE